MCEHMSFLVLPEYSIIAFTTFSGDQIYLLYLNDVNKMKKWQEVNQEMLLEF